MRKKAKKSVENMVNETLSALYQEEIFYRAVMCGIECNVERWGVLREIFRRIDEFSVDELQEKVFKYGSLIGEEDLLARQIFQWFLTVVEEKKKN